MGRTTSRLCAVAIAAAGLADAAAATPSAPDFWLSVVADGAYRVTFDELMPAGGLEPVPSRELGLTQAGTGVPIAIEDGGDGVFGPGDWFEFVGEHLRGVHTHFHEHSPFNVYRLVLDGGGPRWLPAHGDRGSPPPTTGHLRRARHFESDRIMARFRPRAGQRPRETWFWERLSFLPGGSFSTRVALDGLAEGESQLRFDLKGWSHTRPEQRGELEEHRVEFSVNGVPVGSTEWGGAAGWTTEIDALPAGVLQPTTEIELTVPARTPHGADDPLVDLSLLNWFEVDYPHDGAITTAQTEVMVAGDGRRAARLQAPDALRLVAFASDGRRWTSPDGGPARLTVIVDQPEATIVAVPGAAFHSVASIRVDRPSRWRSSDHSADYLMVAHPTLLDGAERLAAYHRSRGLEVEVIDVDDLYDEFNHGIPSPAAIRDFVRQAAATWSPSSPRFLLLVGDASWDIDGRSVRDENYADWSFLEMEATREGFLKNQSTAYPGGVRHRGLVPTGSYASADGHAASDNYYAALEDGNPAPSLAVGRIPVVEPADLEAIVDKTIRYIEDSGVGPWRRRILWISNEERQIQARNDELAEERGAVGFVASKVYPERREPSNQAHQESLIRALDEGQLVVYFHGHGGRYIWRTGAQDITKNHDLFNLDHLDRLAPTPRLPVVLSMTCYSGPFDHPLADSIGEKFLRLPDSGAIAVLAASWRNSPAHDMSRALVRELTRPQTIGEAVLVAKRETRRADMIETYNLFGDPAVPVAAPQRRLELVVERQSAGRWRVETGYPDDDAHFAGRAVVDWLAADHTVLASEELEVRDGRLDATLDRPDDRAVRVAVYMWDADRGVDAIGAADLPPPELEPTPTPAAGSP